MAKNNLGKGLNGLFGLTNNVVQSQTKLVDTFITRKDSQETIVNIPLNMIDPDLEQPRKIFNEDALKELAKSIKIHGVLQPIMVTKRNGRYVIISGERRWRASKLCEKTDIPCIVKDCTPEEIREISLVENLQREDLNPIESARAIKELKETYSWSDEKLAERLGKQRSTITNIIRLLNLEPEVVKLVEEGTISSGHAKVLLGIQNREKQLYFAKRIEDKHLSVRQLETAIKQDSYNKPTIKKKVLTQSEELKDFKNDMEKIFGTKVNIIGDDNKGKIEIEYFTFDDIQRIYDLVQKIKKY